MFLVAIQVEALDRHRLLSDVTRVLSDERISILSASVHDHPRPGRGQPVHLRAGRPEAPRHLLQTMRNVEGVYDVDRVTA